MGFKAGQRVFMVETGFGYSRFELKSATIVKITPKLVMLDEDIEWTKRWKKVKAACFFRFTPEEARKNAILNLRLKISEDKKVIMRLEERLQDLEKWSPK